METAFDGGSNKMMAFGRDTLLGFLIAKQQGSKAGRQQQQRGILCNYQIKGQQ
jgi:hypothetical protein